MDMNAKEKAAARWLQGDLPDGPRPYAVIGEAVGLSEGEVLDLLDRLRAAGVIRKFAAIVRHRQAGYERNVMALWAVPEEACDAVGHLFASQPEITHCYERTPPFAGRYNLFTMMHFRNEDPREWVEKLAAKAKLDDYRLLFSEEEFKKSSMIYF